MKTKNHTYVYVFIFLWISSINSFSQELSLKISAKEIDSTLSKISFKKKHLSIESINEEATLISEELKQKGYFTNSIDSITINKNEYNIHYSLGKKINTVLIKTDKKSIFLKPNQLETFLTHKKDSLENKGESFSEVKLTNINTQNDTLVGKLNIFNTKRRKINKIKVEGYSKFPVSFLKNYLKIDNKTIFNDKTLKSINTKMNYIDFVKQIKQPEVLFTKDSTILYVYLEKKRNNSFDGLLNFASNDKNSKLQLTGYLNLELNNTFNTGEKIQLNWEANGNDRKSFNLSTFFPYLFNSRFSTELNFKIHKQDSSFLNTEFKSSLFYNISYKTQLGISYESINSETNNNTLNISDYNSQFIGLKFSTKTFYNPEDSWSFEKFHFSVNPAFGSRKTNNSKDNQLKLTTELSYLFKLSSRNHLYLRNETGFLNTDNYLNNELFRIGGVNSIRGFQEESIFTSKYSFINLEYRYLTNEKSYLYSITDFGAIYFNKKTNKPLGLGLGYSFTTKSNLLNIAYALRKTDSSNLNLKQSIILIKIKSFF